MSRLRVAVAVLLLSSSLAACTVPHKKGSVAVHKVAATQQDAAAVLERYRRVRSLADRLSDPKPLSTVEAGPLLAIDAGSFGLTPRPAPATPTDTPRAGAGGLDAIEIAAPLASRYPLWFLAQVRDRARDVIKVQVFERPTSVDGWLLVAGPEILADTALPPLRRGPRGTLVTLPTGAATGPRPQAVADAYAEALADPRSAAAGRIENDSFIRQMRTVADSNRRLTGVGFRQQWSAEPVRFAVRTDDGGALVFATLERRDGYHLSAGTTVRFPAGSPQQAFLGRDATASGTLRYYHQVLLYVPGTGGGKPRALGQYGGVVGADGF